jgi:hypothetical protein
MLRSRSSVLAAVLLIGLAGCADKNHAAPTTSAGGGGPLTPSASAPGADSHRAKVSTRDYEAAVGRLRTCLQKSGIELINDGWDPVDNERMILRYKAPGADFKTVDTLTGECESAYLDPVASRYVEDNGSHMEPDLMAAVQKCLTGKGVDLTGREKNPADLLKAVPERRHEELRECVRGALNEQYPKVIGAAFP